MSGNLSHMSAEWLSSQFTASQSSFKGATGATGGSSRSGFQDEARKRYARRLKEEYEEKMERVERVRRMQSIFNRERNKHRKGYERRREDTSAEYHFYNHFQRDDWYWKTDTTYGNWSNFREPHQTPANYSLSHHYAVLGLSRSRTTPYTDDEIKTAFRSKAKQYHPDQHQENKEVAEARFKEVMTSYEAIKSERKNMN
ncbi:DnaJ domain-containing protein [Tanacetum coccineum]